MTDFMTATLAIYGGSFDPPHVAHTLVCSYVLSAHRIDRLLIVPTAQHPFDKRLSDFEHRVRMCELAMRDLRRVEVCPIEAELSGPSLTLHTLQALAQRNPGAQLHLVLGSDLLRETHAWHRFDEIAQLAPPIVVQRAGHETAAGLPALPDISSTEARRRLRAGEPTVGLLDPEVADYAREHGLYR
jgi:nicotinate-nucleotide adenylyltransferase